MTGLAGPFLWLAGITKRAISLVMFVCHEFGTICPSIRIAAILLMLLSRDKFNKGKVI